MELGWLNLDHIRKLKKLVLEQDFNVQSDALETMRVSNVSFSSVVTLSFRSSSFPLLGLTNAKSWLTS